MAAGGALDAVGIAAGVLWLAQAALAHRLPGVAVRRALIGVALAASVLTAVLWAAHGATPVGTPGMALAVLGLALGAWVVPPAVGGRSARALAAAAGALTLAGTALPVGPPAVVVARGWRLLSDGALALGVGSLLAGAMWPATGSGAADRRLPAGTALILGILALVAYAAGAQQHLGDYAPGSPGMSHRFAALLAIALVAVDGGARRRAPILAAGLFGALVVLASSPLAAWLGTAEAVIYP